MSVTIPCGNLAQESSNVGWFYVVNTPKILDQVKEGWYAHGPGLENIKVTAVSDSVDYVWKYITIEEPNVFKNQSTNYVFTAFPVLENENTVKMTAIYKNLAEVETDTAWFYVGYNPQFLELVQPGWFIQGEGLRNVNVISVTSSVDRMLVFIKTNESNIFKKSDYSFTSFPMNRVIANESSDTISYNNIPDLLKDVEVGWYAQGEHILNAKVSAIDKDAKTVSIAGSKQTFTAGTSYYFSEAAIM